MYHTVAQTFYWPHMAADVDYIGRSCASCARNQPKYRRRRKMYLFLASGPLRRIAMDFTGPISKTVQGNQNILVTTDRYSKLTVAIPASKTTAPLVASMFMDHWIVLYSVPKTLLTGGQTQFLSKFFAILCALLRVEHLTPAAYYSQTNNQTKLSSKTIFSYLPQYVAEHQLDWNTFVQP